MPAPRFALRVELPEGQAWSAEVVRARSVLGRSAGCDLQLAAEGVSREHAVLLIEGVDLWVEDLGSTNGTLVNGARISTRLRLADGDELGIGRARVVVQVDARQAVDVISDTIDTPTTSLVATLAADEPAPAGLSADQKALRSLYQLARGLEPGVSEGELRRRVLDVVLATLEPERVILQIGADRLQHGEGEPVAGVVERLARGSILTLADERAVLAVPLVMKTASAWVYVDAPAARRFQPRDLDLLTVVAHNAAALLDNARLVARLSQENRELREELAEKPRYPAILGGSGALEAVLRTVQRLAETDATALITGESGTGKELIARTIHLGSARKAAPFVAINCAAIPDNLIEAELFGIEKGVATGVDRRAGKFEAAGDGTIFLDEVGELPLGVQAKLLRVLEERVVERLGSTKSVPVKARVVAATNRNLAVEVAAGRFREDLFYRLNVVPIRLPALRERVGDVRVLAEAFLRRVAEKQGRRVRSISAEALAALETYHWPGNVRELANEIERIVTVWDGGDVVRLEDLAEHIRAAEARPSHFVEELEVGDIKNVVGKLVERAERQLIRAALAKTGDNRARAAALLGLTREGLRKKMLRYGMKDE